MSKSRLIFVSVAAVLIIVLIGGFLYWFKGVPHKPKEVTLTFWGVFDDSDNYSGLIAAFKNDQLMQERSPKDVAIEYRKFEYEDYEKSLRDAWSRGQGPDIFLIHNTWLPNYQEYITPYPQADKDDMNFDLYKQSFMSVATYDFTRGGQIYAAPLSIDTLALYYNKDILEEYYRENPSESNILEPPTTWSDFIDRVGVVTKKDEWGNLQRAGAAMGTANNINRSTDILYLIMLQTGTQMVSDDFTKAEFAKTTTADGSVYNPGERSLEFYTDFANPKKKIFTWNRQKDYSIDEFAEGDVAMMLGYSYLIGSLEKKSPNLNYGIAPAPQLAQAQKPLNYANYWGLSVPRFSKDTKTAWDFIKFASERENVATYLSSTKRPTARADLVTWQEQEMPELATFIRQGLSAKSWYQANPDAIEKIFLEMIEKINYNSSTISRAINDAAKEVTNLMRGI